MIPAGQPGSNYPHAAGKNNMSNAACCAWCGATAGCTGFTNYLDPSIHGVATCMLTNQTAFRSKEPRNVTGGICADGQCSAASCAAKLASVLSALG